MLSYPRHQMETNRHPLGTTLGRNSEVVLRLAKDWMVRESNVGGGGGGGNFFRTKK